MVKMFKIGVNALLIHKNKVLLGKRLVKAGFGEWGFPGGHIDFLQLVNDPRQEDHFIHINFLVKKWSGKLENKEPNKCEEWRWFDLSNLPENIFFGHEKFLPAYIKNINFIS